jgi:hypothetical protein
MPALGIPAIIGLVSAAVGGTELGVNLAGVGKPSTPDPSKQIQQQQQQQAAADALAKQKAIQANLSNAQEQGGGALNNPSLTDLAAIIAGLPGESTSGAGKNALSAYLGNPSLSDTGKPQDNLVGSTFGLSGSMG